MGVKGNDREGSDKETRADNGSFRGVERMRVDVVPGRSKRAVVVPIGRS